MVLLWRESNMAYFSTRDIAAISICGALWGVVNTLFAPVFFRATGMPFLCDLIGFAILILGAWWIRKPGALTSIGVIATIINLAMGTGIQFLGFLAASLFFDLVASFIGYSRSFSKPVYTAVSMLLISVASAAVAGAIIGAIFMAGVSLLDQWGGVVGWVGLHMIGGVIGGFIGTTLVLALKKRRINLYSTSQIKRMTRMVIK
jgi:hypothetical protein